MSNAAFKAQYIAFKYLKTASEYALELRIPRHAWASVYEIIGDPPDAGESKWMGIAPIKDE